MRILDRPGHISIRFVYYSLMIEMLFEIVNHKKNIYCVLVKYQHFAEMLVNVGILPEHKKYAGSDLLVRAGIFLCVIKFLVNYHQFGPQWTNLLLVPI